MPNKKRRCPYCKKYNLIEDAKKVNNSYFCDLDHAVQYGIKNKLKGSEIRHKERKKKLKDSDKSLRNRAAQAACNKYIRERDKGLPCISCGSLPNYSDHIGGSGIQAGHYKTRGASPELRFEELNIHVQCYRCNVQLSGNIENYRINLIKKIGLDKVKWLEGPHEPKKYTCEDLKEIELKYKQKLKELLE